MKTILVILSLIAVLSLSGKSAPSMPPALRAAIPPWPAVIAYAAAQHFEIDKIEGTRSDEVGRPGDSITILVTFRAGDRRKQWLTECRIGTPTTKESADHPPLGLTINSSTSGRKFQFGTGPNMALDIRTAGPFLENQISSIKEKHGRIFISSDLLGLGLDQGCRSTLQQRESRILSTPAAASATNRPAGVALSEQDERAGIGSFVALIEFFKGILITPGMLEILWEITDKPSIWSMMKHGGGITANFEMGGDGVAAEPSHEAFPGRTLYRFPLAISINEKPALRATLMVTSPVPPLLACAGIIEVAAEPPGNSDKRLDLRVIAAHRSVP